jgi:hypothetical protein
MNAEQLMECELAGELKYMGETPLLCLFPTTNPTLPDLVSNPGCCGGSLMTYCLIYGTVLTSHVWYNLTSASEGAYYYLQGWRVRQASVQQEAGGKQQIVNFIQEEM